MLFGSTQLQASIINDVIEFSQKINIKPIFISAIGSISQGLQSPDSDYDLRVLYINKDFPRKIILPADLLEKDLRHKVYFDSKIYDCVPFWDIGTFLQLLIHPSTKDCFTLGFYNIVNWTMFSPYNWDPYGIQNKIAPLLRNIFNPKYAVEYYLSDMDRWLDQKDEIVNRSYLYGIFAGLSIDWIMTYNTFNPIYMRTMLPTVKDNTVREEIEKIMSDAIVFSKDFVQNNKNVKLQDSHFQNKIKRLPLLDKYIADVKERAQNYTFNEYVDIHINKEKTLNSIYDIIDYSVNKEQQLGDNISYDMGLMDRENWN